MLICDCCYASLLFLYLIWLILRLLIASWKYSRHEAKIHMPYFVLNATGLLLSLPIVIDNLLTFITEYDEYSDLRWVGYADFVGKCLPSLVYLLTTKPQSRGPRPPRE